MTKYICEISAFSWFYHKKGEDIIYSAAKPEISQIVKFDTLFVLSLRQSSINILLTKRLDRFISDVKLFFVENWSDLRSQSVYLYYITLLQLEDKFRFSCEDNCLLLHRCYTPTEFLYVRCNILYLTHYMADFVLRSWSRNPPPFVEPKFSLTWSQQSLTVMSSVGKCFSTWCGNFLKSPIPCSLIDTYWMTWPTTAWEFRWIGYRYTEGSVSENNNLNIHPPLQPLVLHGTFLKKLSVWISHIIFSTYKMLGEGEGGYPNAWDFCSSGMLSSVDW